MTHLCAIAARSVTRLIVGGKMQYSDGAIAVPSGPGLGVELDREKLAEYAELYVELGGYPYDREPGRPQWYPLLPNTDFADPAVGGVPPALQRAYDAQLAATRPAPTRKATR